MVSKNLQPSQVNLAKSLRDGLPLEVIDVIKSDSWTGGALIRLKDQITRPSAEELGANAMWLLPFVKYSPHKARFKTDSFCVKTKTLNIVSGFSDFNKSNGFCFNPKTAKAIPSRYPRRI